MYKCVNETFGLEADEVEQVINTAQLKCGIRQLGSDKSWASKAQSNV